MITGLTIDSLTLVHLVISTSAPQNFAMNLGMQTEVKIISAFTFIYSTALLSNLLFIPWFCLLIWRSCVQAIWKTLSEQNAGVLVAD